MIVVDASVVVEWHLMEDGHEFATRLPTTTEPLITPALIAVEVDNVLWQRSRRREIDEPLVSGAVASLRKDLQMLVAIDSLIDRATDLSCKLDHPACDCLYIACAERFDAPLVSDDRRLLRLLGGVGTGVRPCPLQNVGSLL